ncbi:MAG: PAS domain S-box protein [Deltaproteobacteria bacterium]|nr:PAS domain S-box protein [Deltaproteobacteria bacterium]TLN03270.1 MAG: PAS domain S-box protein [bacterium]
MPWIIIAATATASSVLILTLVNIYLYLCYKERFMKLWAIAWGIHTCRYLFLIASTLLPASSILKEINYLCIIASAVVLLAGTSHFMGKPIGGKAFIIGILIAIWTVISISMSMPAMNAVIPIFAFLTFTYIHIGIQFLKNSASNELASRITGWLFIIWGIHQADYPILRPIEWFAPWGFLIGGILATTIAMGMILIYFERTQRALQAKDDRHNQLIESSHNWIWEVDANAVYTFASPQVRKLLGYAPDEIIGKTPFDLMPEDEANCIKDIFDGIAARQEPFFCLESTYLHIDGRRVVLETSGVPFYDDFGVFCGYRGMAQDVTERRKTAQILAQSEERFRSLIEQAPEAIVVFDVDEGRIVDTNPAAERLFGCSRDELLKGGLQRFYMQKQPDGLSGSESVAENIRRVLSGELVNTERNIRTADGRDLICELHLALLPFEGSRLFRMSFIDITDRISAEIKASELAKRLQLATYSAHIGVWDWNIKDNILTWDDQMLALYGHTRETFDSCVEAWYQGIYPDDREPILRLIQKALNGECGWDTEFRIMRPNGEVRWVKADGTIIRDSDGTPVRMLGVNRDITDRKIAETELQRHTLKLRSILDNLPMMAWLKDTESRLEMVNQPYAESCGRTIQECLGKSDLDLYPPEFAAIHMEDDREVCRSGQRKQVEEQVATPDGVRWAFTCKTPITDEKGNVVGTAGIALDITPRKEAERALREKEFFFSASQRAAMVGSYKVDFATGLWESSDVLDNIFGIDRDYGRNIQGWLDIVHPEDREMIQRYLLEDIISNRQSFNKDYRIKRIDNGELRWVLGLGSLEFDAEGNAVMMRGVVQDITERKRVEEALTASMKFNQQIICSAQEGVIVYGRDLCYKVWNPFMEQLTGFRAVEVLGKYPLDVFPFLKDAGVIDRLENVLKGEDAEDIEFPFSIRGNSGWAVDSSVPLRADSGEIVGVLGIVRDTTKQRKAEEQLRQSQKMEAIGLLAGGVAHDFNNILTVISGYSALLKMDGSLNEHQKGQIEEIATSAEKAAQLTQGLLAFSRKQTLMMRQENLNEIIQHVHKFLARIIGEDVKLNTSCSGAELPIMADKGQIEQVLINLATNARDAMPKGGEFRVVAEMVLLDESFTDFHKSNVPPGRYALLTVSDTGSGISSEHIDHIFEPFFTTKEVGKGTGLGMAVIYGIIKQHNGFINVYSEPGLGTAFRIYLPIYENVSLLKEPKVEIAPQHRGDEIILVAEDEPSVRALVSRILTSYGYKVILAEDGDDAVEKFMANRDKISLVILDVIMPKKNGKEAYDDICRIMPGIKVLFSTGYTADFIENRGISDEGVELIMKPVKPTELLRKVREVLDA